MLLAGPQAALAHGGTHAEAETSNCQVDIGWKVPMPVADRNVSIPRGGKLNFKWMGHHDVADVHDLLAYDSCDKTHATTLSAHHGHDHDHRFLAAAEESYAMKVGSSSGVRYIICSVADHCAQGQKLNVTVTEDGSCLDDGLGSGEIAAIAVCCAVVVIAVGRWAMKSRCLSDKPASYGKPDAAPANTEVIVGAENKNKGVV